VTDAAADLVRLVDALEGHADGYITLEQVEQAAGRSLAEAVAEGLLLVDHRERVDAASGARTPVTLCRLNRRHPLVQELTAW
jgi:hypothetical protein